VAASEYNRDSKRKIDTGKYNANDATPAMFLQLPKRPTEAAGEWFEVGHKLEVIDPYDMSCVVLGTVSQILEEGYFMVTFGDPELCVCYHFTSPLIFPIGFSEAHGIDVEPVSGHEPFNIHRYMRDTGSKAVPESAFPERSYDHEFKPEQKVECVDLQNPKLVCVATIIRVAGPLVRIGFDGWGSEYDQWLDYEAPEMFPVGYCEMMGWKLEGPRAELGTNQTKK
jgi:hypothetical protein